MRIAPVALLLLASCSNSSRDAKPTANTPQVLIDGARARFHFRANGEPALLPAVKPVLARVDYPARADAPVHVVDNASGLDVNVTVVGAAARAGEESDGVIAYRDALGEGVPLFHRSTEAGTEDFVLFERAPTSARVSFKIALGEKVAGLRLVGNIVELLDAGGAPRIRVPSPWLVGRDGDVVDARLAIEGCSYDTDGAPPWGRATIDPGARTCTVHVSWERDAVVYPALLDPAWQSAGTIAVNRNNATVTGCTGTTTSDRILVAGGTNASTGATLASAEVFSAASNTWAATNSMVTARRLAVATADTIYNNDIYVTGGLDGSGGAIGANEKWSCSAGTWSTAGSFTARTGHALAISNNGWLFAVGGRSTSGAMVANIARLQLGGGTSWGSSSGPALADLTAYAANGGSFPDGSSSDYCVVWMGGRGATGSASNQTGAFCDGVDGPVGPRVTATLPGPRFGHRLVKSGTVYLLVGGSNGSSDLATVDVFNPGAFQIFGTSGISAGSPMPVGRFNHVAVAVNSLDVLVAGGSGANATTSHLYLGSAGTWISAGPLLGSHANGLAGSALPAGGALLVGGPSAPERWARRANGTACTEVGECASGFCVDSVCCNAACTGTCESCSATLKVSGASGTCGPTKSGGDSKGRCTASAASTCGDDGTCSGTLGVCRKWPSGTVCVAQSCASTTLQNNQRTCNGSGTCQALTTTTCAAAYVCTGAACATSCTGTDDTKCAPGHYCNGSTCVASLAKATTCTRDRECASGFCTDGVCCAVRCGGICEACSAAFKGSGSDGDCGLVPANNDPRNQCARDSGYPASCKADGFCNGAGACRTFAVAGTECGAPTCAAGKASTSLCDGGGVCSLTEKSCAPSTCNTTSTACLGDCASDTECAATAYCDATTKKCVEKRANGAAATDARECTSGIVADGVCCNDACTGICEACDGAATKGTCTAVAGKARHGDCPPGGTGEDACKASSCDGTDRKACAAKAGSDVACRSASCSGGVETLETRCDGSGVCPAASTKNCQPYACSGATCKLKCATNDDCASGFFCDPVSGICGAGASCVNETTLKRSDGTTETCVAFKCSGQQCLKTCTSTTDCLSGHVCNSSNGQCESTAPATEDDGGCAMGSARSTSGAWVVFAAALVVWSKRRARCATPRRR